MNHTSAISTVMVSYSALTAGWIGTLGYFALKRDGTNPQAGDISETARAERLVIERYGASFARQEPATLKWWIVTESGEILCSGDTEGDAWISSAFMNVDESR